MLVFSYAVAFPSAAVDNGEGEGEAADRLSALFARSPESGIDCSNFTPPTTTPIVSGNLQVRP